jgi:hypothetical protein
VEAPNTSVWRDPPRSFLRGKCEMCDFHNLAKNVQKHLTHLVQLHHERGGRPSDLGADVCSVQRALRECGSGSSSSSSVCVCACVCVCVREKSSRLCNVLMDGWMCVKKNKMCACATLVRMCAACSVPCARTDAQRVSVVQTALQRAACPARVRADGCTACVGGAYSFGGMSVLVRGTDPAGPLRRNRVD